MWLRAFALSWVAKLGRNVANIPIPVALVAIDQFSLNHLKGIDGERRLGKEALRVTAVCETQGDSLGVVGLHVQQRPNFRTCEAALSHRLLREVPAMRE